MKPFRLTWILMAAVICNATADDIRGEVEFSINARAKTTKAGTPFALELEYNIAPGWHIGPQTSKVTIPTELEWTLPEGVKLVKVEWPELNYFGNPPGFQGKVILHAKLQAAKDLKPGAKLTIGVRSSWQVCKGICKLGEATKLVKVTVAK